MWARQFEREPVQYLYMISPLVLAIIGAFFLITFLIGVVDRKKVTLDDFWVNARKTNKWILVATISSTYVGVGSLLANAGVAYRGGGFATLVLGASAFLYFLLFAKFFAPKIKEFGDKYNAYTLLDFLKFRYSKNVHIAGLATVLITYGLWLAVQILGMSIFVSAISGLDPTLATLLGGLIVVGYTTVGGLRADIRTDVFQFIVMLGLLFIFVPFVIIKGGGFESVSSLPASFLGGQEFAPWYVFLFGFLFIGASHFVSAELWQRAYAGDSAKNVRWAMMVGGAFVALFLIAGTLFGIFGHILLPEVGENMVVPALLSHLLPPVLFGIVLAGFFAAIMSTADTMLLVLSMAVVHDFYEKTLGKEISKARALELSRIVTFVGGGLAVLIALAVFNIVHLAIGAVGFFVVLLPAVIFGFYWKKATSAAALWSIILGLITVIAFLFISPVEAFIPGIIVSFLSFFVVNAIVRRRGKTAPMGRAQTTGL